MRYLTIILLFFSLSVSGQNRDNYWLMENSGANETGLPTLILKNNAAYSGVQKHQGSYSLLTGATYQRAITSAKVDWSSGAISMGGWVYYNTGTGTTIFVSNRTAGGDKQGISFEIDKDNDRLKVTQDGGSSEGSAYSANGSFLQNEWVHYFVVIPDVTQNIVRIYINGQRSGTDSIGYIGSHKNDTLCIGALRDGGYYTNAYYDEFLTFGRALSSAEVLDIYTNGYTASPLVYNPTVWMKYKGIKKIPKKLGFPKYVGYGIESFPYVAPITLGTFRYLADVPNGTNITTALTDTIAASSDGDIIVLPRGHFVINTQIAITDKDIHIIGQGKDSTGTILYRTTGSSNAFFYYNDNQYYTTGYSTNKVFISGIMFRGRPSARYGGGTVTDMDKAIVIRHRNFYITDNRMKYNGNAQIEVYMPSIITDFNGLIFDNDIWDGYRPEYGNNGYGVHVWGNHTGDSWQTDPGLGTIKSLYIEDNVFREQRHSVDISDNGRFVVRYNRMVDNWASAVLNVHGAGAGGVPPAGTDYSGRVVEFYNNTCTNIYDVNGNSLTSSTPYNYYTPTLTTFRGGEGLVFNNTATGVQKNLYFWIERVLDTPYPTRYQTGYNSAIVYGSGDTGYSGDHGNGDVFFWNNTHGSERPEFTQYSILGDPSPWLKLNRDIHAVQKPGYQSYTYPHPYRNYYYSFCDSLWQDFATLDTSNVTSSSVTLTWTDVLLEDGYKIYVSDDNTTFTLHDTVAMNDTSEVVTGLAGLTQYWIYVKPYNDNHLGLKSQTVLITTK
jgi:hypothetical protein